MGWVFPWFSIHFWWISHGFPSFLVDFPWISIIFGGFPMVFPWFSHGFRCHSRAFRTWTAWRTSPRSCARTRSRSPRRSRSPWRTRRADRGAGKKIREDMYHGSLFNIHNISNNDVQCQFCQRIQSITPNLYHMGH